MKTATHVDTMRVTTPTEVGVAVMLAVAKELTRGANPAGNSRSG